jgi:hypothetical protein
MKVIIDLIEDIRESVANAEEYVLRAGLLKEDMEDASRLHYVGEASIDSYCLDEEKRELLFRVGDRDAGVTVGELIPSLLILDMQVMMYPLKMDVNVQYSGVEIVGFGKSDEEKSYLLFIKV